MSVSNAATASATAAAEKPAHAAAPQNSSSSEPTSTAERTGPSAEASSSGSSSSSTGNTNSSNANALVPISLLNVNPAGDNDMISGINGTTGDNPAAAESSHYIVSLLNGDTLRLNKREILEANAAYFVEFVRAKNAENEGCGGGVAAGAGEITGG
jgi:hypothetical protein